MWKHEKKELAFKKLSEGGAAKRASLRRKALKEFFSGAPRYVTEIGYQEFLIAKGFQKACGVSVRNDMKKFGYHRINHSWGSRESMALQLRDRRGFMVKSWAYVRSSEGYSKESLSAFLEEKTVWKDEYLEVEKYPVS